MACPRGCFPRGQAGLAGPGPPRPRPRRRNRSDVNLQRLSPVHRHIATVTAAAAPPGTGQRTGPRRLERPVRRRGNRRPMWHGCGSSGVRGRVREQAVPVVRPVRCGRVLVAASVWQRGGGSSVAVPSTWQVRRPARGLPGLWGPAGAGAPGEVPAAGACGARSVRLPAPPRPGGRRPGRAGPHSERATPTSLCGGCGRLGGGAEAGAGEAGAPGEFPGKWQDARHRAARPAPSSRATPTSHGCGFSR